MVCPNCGETMDEYEERSGADGSLLYVCPGDECGYEQEVWP